MAPREHARSKPTEAAAPAPAGRRDAAFAPVPAPAAGPLTPGGVLRLQRTVGNRAVTRLLAGAGGRRGAVQRTPEWKAANHADDYLDAFVAALDDAVQAAATAALDPDGLAEIDGYVSLWKDTAVILRAIQDGDIDTDDSDAVAEANAARSFAAARYGYAVESIACSQAEALRNALPDGCTYQLQASRGMTRPDIVVNHKDQGEVGWFDITSAASKGHIDRKTGSGWKTRPYVAEITYPVLDASSIGTGNLGIGERVARRNAMRRRVRAWEALLVDFRRGFTRAWNRRDGDEQNKAGRQAAAREVVAEMLGVDEVAPQMTKSVIRALAWSVKDYGFDSGGTKAEGESILRNHFGV